MGNVLYFHSFDVDHTKVCILSPTSVTHLSKVKNWMHNCANEAFVIYIRTSHIMFKNNLLICLEKTENTVLEIIICEKQYEPRKTHTHTKDCHP